MNPPNKIAFDNEWIVSHYSYDSTWVELCRRYNEEHGTDINYSTFKYHCNHRLNLKNSYHDGLTEEQEEFLRAVYPIKGGARTAEEFNAKFRTNILPATLKTYCNRSMKLKVSEERLSQVKDDATRLLLAKRCHPIGTVMVRGDEGLCVKTEEGWKRLSWMALGIENLPKNHKVIHLDGDITNNSPENLKVIDAKTWGIMSAHDLWSVDAEITKTGIVWSKLYEQHKRRFNHAEIRSKRKRTGAGSCTEEAGVHHHEGLDQEV